MNFSLQPFPDQTSLPSTQIRGKIVRQRNHVSVSYHLLNPFYQVVIPASCQEPLRQDELWTTTCLELFFGPTASETYWEVNLSPAGHWNIYRFDAYRSGMREEKQIKTLPFQIQHQADTLHLQLDLDLQPLAAADQLLEVAIAAVIESKQGQISYWALQHSSSEADFHQRDSFILKI